MEDVEGYRITCNSISRKCSIDCNWSFSGETFTPNH